MPSSAPSVPLLSEDATTYVACPKCKSKDIKGPIVTPTGQRAHPPLCATKAWFCRSCWWDTSAKFRDDVAENGAR